MQKQPQIQNQSLHLRDYRRKTLAVEFICSAISGQILQLVRKCWDRGCVVQVRVFVENRVFVVQIKLLGMIVALRVQI